MTAFFIAHCWFTPFLEPVNNASEWFSRVNYVLTSVISLLVVLSVPGESILDGPVLYMLVYCLRLDVRPRSYARTVTILDFTALPMVLVFVSASDDY